MVPAMARGEGGGEKEREKARKGRGVAKGRSVRRENEGLTGKEKRVSRFHRNRVRRVAPGESRIKSAFAGLDGSPAA